MAMTINTNTASNNALTQLGRTTKSLGSTFERVSSGLRINKAGDDAAGLAMAEKLDATGRGLRQAMRNANDGISVIEVAEGAANEVGNIVKRMRELAVQSSSETLGTTERTYIQAEIIAASAEVDRIANVTSFNGVALGNGTNATIAVQVGVNNTVDDRIDIALGDLSAATIGVDIVTINLTTAAGAQLALTALDLALDTVNGYRADLGATQNRVESAIRNLETNTDKNAGAQSRIRDADFAFETAQMAKYQIIQQSGVAVLGQANQMNQSAMRLIQ